MKKGAGMLAALSLALCGIGKSAGEASVSLAAAFGPNRKAKAKPPRSQLSSRGKRLRAVDAYGTTYRELPSGQILRTSAKGARPNAARKAERRAARERVALAA